MATLSKFCCKMVGSWVIMPSEISKLNVSLSLSIWDMHQFSYFRVYYVNDRKRLLKTLPLSYYYVGWPWGSAHIQVNMAQQHKRHVSRSSSLPTLCTRRAVRQLLPYPALRLHLRLWLCECCFVPQWRPPRCKGSVLSRTTYHLHRRSQLMRTQESKWINVHKLTSLYRALSGLNVELIFWKVRSTCGNLWNSSASIGIGLS